MEGTGTAGYQLEPAPPPRERPPPKLELDDRELEDRELEVDDDRELEMEDRELELDGHDERPLDSDELERGRVRRGTERVLTSWRLQCVQLSVSSISPGAS